MPLNPWLANVMESFYAARDAWELAAEAASNGWATELAEFAEANPQPRLRDFLSEMSHGEPNTRKAS